jgi:hypothetical protein
VICCRPGNAEAAMTRMTALMTRLGLESIQNPGGWRVGLGSGLTGRG